MRIKVKRLKFVYKFKYYKPICEVSYCQKLNNTKWPIDAILF